MWANTKGVCITLEFGLCGGEKLVNVVEGNNSCAAKVVEEIVLEESEDDVLVRKGALQEIVDSVREREVAEETEKASCRTKEGDLLVGEERVSRGTELKEESGAGHAGRDAADAVNDNEN